MADQAMTVSRKRRREQLQDLRERVRGEHVMKFVPGEIYKKCVHWSVGDGIRCDLKREAPNSTSDLGRISCKRCINWARTIMDLNVRHTERLLEGLPPMYQGCGITPADLERGLQIRKDLLAAFEAHHGLDPEPDDPPAKARRRR